MELSTFQKWMVGAGVINILVLLGLIIAVAVHTTQVNKLDKRIIYIEGELHN
jgi:hypothetical protein